jgi:hypothetical protein
MHKNLQVINYTKLDYQSINTFNFGINLKIDKKYFFRVAIITKNMK